MTEAGRLDPGSSVIQTSFFTMVHCPTTVHHNARTSEYYECGEEISIEWSTVLGDDGPEQEVISYRTWCWHSFSKEIAYALLEDLAARATEKKSEGE